jgi:3-phenylpropionate/cinnamic acid dioxygenase small subunit
MTDISLLGDRLAIEDVFARYAHTADGYDAEGWLNCFAEDGQVRPQDRVRLNNRAEQKLIKCLKLIDVEADVDFDADYDGNDIK